MLHVYYHNGFVPNIVPILAEGGIDFACRIQCWLQSSAPAFS